MRIDGKEYTLQDVSRTLTVPDSIVIGPNKIGRGHGEAKFYIGTKQELNAFALGKQTMECFFLKSDLQKYMLTARKEYEHPTQNYAGKASMTDLWKKRVQMISELPEMIMFTVDIQSKIEGDRGYVNSEDKAYQLFRTLSLPYMSYMSVMRLINPQGKTLYYWRLFVDFDALSLRGIVPLAFSYGKGSRSNRRDPGCDVVVSDSSKSAGRDAAAQHHYREKLLNECPYCPITMISDERLLVASHIKPCAVSEAKEAFDPKNGFTLSPLYDRLFDQGFITFDERKCMVVSNWLSPANQERCRVRSGEFIQMLPLDEKREFYMQYHRQYVFKG